MVREEKVEGGDRGDLVETKESPNRERAVRPVINFLFVYTVWNTPRGSRSSIEKRRGRKDIEVTRRRGGAVKRRGTNLTSDQFPKFSPQPGTPKEILRVK